MQQPREADPESSRAHRRFPAPGQGRIVELQLVQSLAQFRIIVDWIKPSEPSACRRPVAAEILRSRPAQRGDRIAEPPYLLNAGDQIADLTSTQEAAFVGSGEMTPTSNVSCAALVDIINTRSRCDSSPSTTRM